MSESDLNGHWLDRACRARPDLVPALRALLASHPDLRSLEEIARLEKEGEPGIAALVTLNAGRYYMNPKIRELIGYPGQGGRDPSLPEYGWDRAADLLERVVGRGPIYREAH